MQDTTLSPSPSAPAAAQLPEPVLRLAAAFQLIHATRMADLPFVNPALQVEVVGFRRWQGRWLGVLITPWFMNLVLLPDEPDRWLSVPLLESASYAFAAGVFDFIAATEDGVGEFQSCSLFSPVFEFEEQAVARATAVAALASLFDPAARPGVEGPTYDRPAPDAAAATAVEPAPAPEPEHLANPSKVTKRDFLRGRWSA